MEDYPILGIRSMEERTRLFHLIQMVKTLDLENLEYEDCDDDEYYTDGADESFCLVENRIAFDGCGDPDEDVCDKEDEKGAAVSDRNEARFTTPSRVRRRLDFSCENVNNHQKPSSCLVGTVHFYQNRNNEPSQGKGSAIPAQLDLDRESAVAHSYKGNNHKLDIHSHQSDHHAGENTKPDVTGGISLNNSLTRLSTKHIASHKPQPNQQTKQKTSNKPVRHRYRKGIPRKEKLNTEISSSMASEHVTKPTPVYESKRTAGYNYGLPLSSPPAPDKKQPVGQRISVCVRKRPLKHTECRRGEADVVTTPTGECVIVHESKEAVDLSQYILQHRFYFDQVFGEESSNEDVYQRTAFPLVQHMLSGGKATCFAYGQTGAGKTHTMLGSSSGRPGLYALAVRDIFAHLSTTDTYPPLLVYVSFFEIYCGQLYDLLNHRKRLFAREDGQKVVHITGLHDVRVESVSSLLQVISQGTEERTQGMSGVNPLSSRSHAVLQIQLRHLNQQLAGRISFVDLAGSERASDTKEPDRQSRLEGAEINQSLLALKECIRSLDQEQSHTPFRQSKLTQVLKDSFVGDSMTCMIANISPGHLATEHTLNTLRYADRVKELRGQGGLRGGRSGKTMSSPKRNLSNSNSNTGGSGVGTRGKSPPKKPKLGRQREASAPTTPTSRLTTGGAVLCSTPKDSRWGEGTSARSRQGIGFEQITPIKGLLEIDDESERVERTGRRTGDRRERYEETSSAGHSAGNQNIRGALVFGHATDEQRESGLNHRGKENQQSTLKERREGKTRWTEQITQVESNRDTCGDIDQLRKRDLQKGDERDKERHLRWYHQQLQQFIPSSASSSDHLFLPSSCPSFSSSKLSSSSSSVSPSPSSSLQHSSPTSTLMYHGLKEEVLDVCGARVKVRTDGSRGPLHSFSSRETCTQTEISSRRSKNKDEVGPRYSGGTSKDWMAALAKTGKGCEHVCSTSEKRRLLKATGEEEARIRRGDLTAGMEGEGERRWAWMTTVEAQPADRATAAGPADVEALMSYSCNSEVGEGEVDASDVPTDEVWSTEKQDRADSFSLVSTHSNSFSNQSPHQRAPAERPLSPACEHTNELPTPNKLSDLSSISKHTRSTSDIPSLLLPNIHQGVPPSSCTEKEPWFASNGNSGEISNAQSTTPAVIIPITQNGCKIPTEHVNILSEIPAYTWAHDHPEVKAEIPVLAKGETSTDSLSYTMDPISISLLQVDQQAATASFLQREQSNTSLCLLDTEKREENIREVKKERITCVEMTGKMVEDEDEEFHLSLLELPQVKTHCTTTSDTMSASDNSERRKGTCFATYKHCGIGMMKPAVPKVMLVSLQDQRENHKPQTAPDNKAPASPPKASTCASIEISVMQPISSCAQHSGNSGSPSSHNPVTNGATQIPPEHTHNVPTRLAFSMSTPQSKRVLGQLNTLAKQCHNIHSNHSSNSNVHVQPNGPTESNSEESTRNLQNRPIIHLSTLEDLYHNQWRVVQAHWEQLEEMETLFRKEGTLLCQQPDMAFGEYVSKLGEIMERKARCVHNMIAQLQPFLKTSWTSQSDQTDNQGQDDHDQVT